MRRFLRLASVGLAVIGVVAAASAHAAGNTKPFTANVRVESASDLTKFRVTLTNDPKATQSLGSANVGLPPGFTAGAVSNITPAGTFNVNVVNNVLQFRAISSSTALGKGASVYADVKVTISSCTNAQWGPVEAKQSNDFSGTPGNDMTLGTSDLTPLGSFTFAPIGTVLANPAGLFVPQRQISDGPIPVTVHALDTCGNLDLDYTGANLTPTPGQAPARLQNATFSPLTFNGTGNGTAAITATDVEAGDTVTATDPLNGISADSTASGDAAHPNSPFDVVELLCAVPGTVCVWPNKNKSITATSTVPGDSNGTASLGIGFRNQASLASTTCSGNAALLGDGVDINPHNYTQPYQVTLVYSKALTGNGPASAFTFCISETNTMSWTPLPACSTTVTTQCVVSQKRITGGALQFILALDPGDPWGGTFG